MERLNAKKYVELKTAVNVLLNNLEEVYEIGFKIEGKKFLIKRVAETQDEKAYEDYIRVSSLSKLKDNK